jgi:hypothetical protein|tara:strand:- start:1593 stop:1739 length:147 start_codon:yes stop_codon:yes gene_type:complete
MNATYLEETTVKVEDTHSKVSLASVLGKQVEAIFDGGTLDAIARNLKP